MVDLVSAIDCGTNSVRLLIASVVEGRVEEVDRRLHITRLGQGVDATGQFAPEALGRTLDAMADFAEELDRLGVDARRVVATSAARDASNSAEFFDGVLAMIGVPVEIISGAEEARLSFAGAVTALPGLGEPVLVIDIGGGSTELARGGRGRLEQAVSLPMGSVRLRERFFGAAAVPGPAQVAAARQYVDDLVDASGLDLQGLACLVGVGGTVTSLSALSQQLATYDRLRVHGSVLPVDAVLGLARRLLGMSPAEIALLPTMVPGRADVISAGALVAARLVARLGLPLWVSESDLLDSIALELAGPR